MARKITPDVELQAAALLTVGFQMTTVAEKMSLSYSTVKRIKERILTGELTLEPEMIDEAKINFEEVLGVDYARQETANIIRSVSSTNQKILEKINAVLDNINVDELDPCKAAKAISALTTASKLAHDTARQTISSLGAKPEISEDLPVLEIREMFDEEIAEIRAKQREQYEDFDCE